MQTRKRAKSATFGKKIKEEREKDSVNEPEKKVAAEEKASEKAEVVERRAVPEKPAPESSELSATPPKTDEEDEVTEEKDEKESLPVATPTNEFVSDTPLSANPEVTPKEPSVIPDANVLSPAVSGESTPSVEPSAQPGGTDQPQADADATQPSEPPSAFTIQEGEAEAAKKQPEVGGKKRFGTYFLVVAFLAFILGLGAMAALSYFNLVHVNVNKIPSIPLIGAKPSPTSPPPTAVPTQKPVDLTAYTIIVLNGSGVSGEAAKIKDSLTTAGFKVGSTGNADNNNFTKTEITARKSVDPAFLKKLEDELGKSFVVDPNVSPAPDSDATNVTVTLGSQTP